MNVPEVVLKSVAFIGYQMADGTFRHAGSACILGRLKTEKYCEPVFFVTARHVIDGIRNLGLHEIYIRVNTAQAGAQWTKTSIDSWFFHPTDSSIDVAIVELGTGPGIDHLVFPLNRCATEGLLTHTSIGLGDEVVITGLFKHHAGKRRGTPIVRIGNIACISEELISTADFGEIDGYLIEARSIGGLSGSPVYVVIGPDRLTAATDQFSGAGLYFLGIIHGHFDERDGVVDATLEAENEHLNTGIAIVVPCQRVLDVIQAYEATGTQSHAIIQLSNRGA